MAIGGTLYGNKGSLLARHAYDYQRKVNTNAMSYLKVKRSTTTRNRAEWGHADYLDRIPGFGPRWAEAADYNAADHVAGART